jgi:hypothetical protein
MGIPASATATVTAIRTDRVMASPPTPPRIAPDLIPLGEVAARLNLTAKAVKRLHRDEGLPLVRFTDGSPYHAFWSDVEQWARSRIAGA